MRRSLEFLVGLLDEQAACVACEDLDGEHGPILRTWQELGFLSVEPVMSPVPSCPHYGEGVPYRLGDRYLCSRCAGSVDRRHLLLWELRPDAFFAWLASALRLRGGVRRLDGSLWQLGTWESHGIVCECFYRRRGPLSEVGERTLSRYRSTILLYGMDRPHEADRAQSSVSLLEVLRPGESLAVIEPAQLLQRRGEVRFDVASGVVSVGGVWLGEVPLGSKEYHFLRCLADHLDRFVPYADLEHFVMRQTGGRDSTDEATFCHRLKNRIKKKSWVAKIDLLLATTNKGDGYRLRGRVGDLAEE